MTANDSAPIRLATPSKQRLPLVVAVPHAGRDYGPRYSARCRLTPQQQRLTEDAFADELAAMAPERGAPLLVALFPRIWLDANRDAREIDPFLIEGDLPAEALVATSNVRAGLGVVPRLLTGGVAIHDGRLTMAEITARIEAGWRPYHEALQGLIGQTRDDFGRCLLIDCHSMPSSRDFEPPDIVLGDGFGQTADPAIMGAAEEFFVNLGYKVARNRPYAGGFTTRHYGKPETGVQALQIEVRRSLYMDEASIERRPGLASMAVHLGELMDLLGRIVQIGKS